jgi:flagellar capping protein FliD
MEAMRVNWTDGRLGERFEQVDERFDRMDQSFNQLRAEMSGRFDRLDARFDAMQRTLFLAAAGVVASLIGLIATQL